MKAKVIAAVLAFSCSQALAGNCPDGSWGTWETRIVDVRVCDRVTENYTESQRVCDYLGWGHLDLAYRSDAVDIDQSKLYSRRDVINTAQSCPASKSISEMDWYQQKNTKHLKMGRYSGSLFKTSDRVETQQKTRVVETNCRIVQQEETYLRCGLEP